MTTKIRFWDLSQMYFSFPFCQEEQDELIPHRDEASYFVPDDFTLTKIHTIVVRINWVRLVQFVSLGLLALFIALISIRILSIAKNWINSLDLISINEWKNKGMMHSSLTQTKLQRLSLVHRIKPVGYVLRIKGSFAT